MLRKIRDRVLWLRWGIMALAIFVPLAIPVTASASATPPVEHRDMHTRTYVNMASAFSWTLSPSNSALKFKLQQSSASTIRADEFAVALAIGCHQCRAVSIAIQVVVVPKQKLAAVHEYTRAFATARDCVRCAVLADAYQIIFATDAQPLVTDRQKLCLSLVNTELEALRNSHVGINQIKDRAADLVNQIVYILRHPSYMPPISTAPTRAADTLSPAANGPAVPGGRAGNNRPVIDVYHAIQS
jgi:hypothetical protein